MSFEAMVILISSSAALCVIHHTYCTFRAYHRCEAIRALLMMYTRNSVGGNHWFIRECSNHAWVCGMRLFREGVS